MEQTHEVVTRRGLMFYFSIGFGILFLGGMAAVLFAIGVDEGSWGMQVGAMLILLMVWYLVRSYFRIAPKVRISFGGITWKGNAYSWDDVSSIKLTGSQPMRVVGGKDMEGTAIVLNNGSQIILLGGMYSNFRAVRQFIAQAAPARLGIQEETEHVRPVRAAAMQDPVASTGLPIPTNDDGVQYVKGNSILNVTGVFAWIFTIGPIIGSILVNNATATFLFMLFALGFGALFTMFINYFGVSDQYIVVRNVYRPWKRKTYPLADVRQVVLASNHNGYNNMRLILDNYSFKEFVGAGLSNSDWIALLQLMRARGIDVKDENNFALWEKPGMKKVKRRMAWYFLLYIIISMSGYMWVTSLDVSENTLIFLKLGWVLFMVLALIGVIKLLARMGGKETEGANSDDESREA